uniref:B30.2/SPRY domain-containing protein n=1 Tax=Panagrolaimus sp. ES5 TaxID=591445 RepID=A0AC34F8D6_9BILA
MDDIPMADATDEEQQHPQIVMPGIYPYPHFINPPHLFERDSSSNESSQHSNDSRLSPIVPSDETEVELVTPHRDINRRISQLYPGVNAEVTPLPTHWSSVDRRDTIYVSPDKTLLKYKGLGVNHQDAASVRANYPIPHGCGVYYFEVTIVTPEKKWNSSASDSLIGIGIMEKSIQTNRLPGWDTQSFGYHGDDGNFFCSSGKGQQYGPKFGINDCVGCGVNFAKKQIFFTKNGENLGYIDINLSLDHEYYPVVGMQASNEVVRTNFGQHPFLYDIQKDFEKARAFTQKSFNSIRLPPEKAIWMNEAVAHWLSHLGYSDTMDAFQKITNIDVIYSRDSLKRRRKVMDVIKEGKVSEYLDYIGRHYDFVLNTNKHLHLLLKVQAFIEDILNVAKEKKNPPPIEPQPGSSRMPIRTQQQRRKVSPSAAATAAGTAASSSQRSGIKRRNSQTESPSSSSHPSYHRSFSRESQNGCTETGGGIDCLNGHNNINNGCCSATTTTIIAEMNESNDTEMEDLSTSATANTIQPPSRRKEVIKKAHYDEYKSYTKLIQKSREIWNFVKQINPLSDKLYEKVMEVFNMMTTDADEISEKFPFLASQNHRDLVATVFNRSLLDFENDCGSRIPIGNLITLLESMHPKISQFSPGGITFANVDEMIFDKTSDDDNSMSEPSSPEGIDDDNEEEEEDIVGMSGEGVLADE